MGVGVYRDDEDEYYFFYGNYVNGERTGQGTSYMKMKDEDKKTYRYKGIYRIFTGEWKNNAPNGFGREEFVYLNEYDYVEESGNIVSEGILKDGLWDGDIQGVLFKSVYGDNMYPNYSEYEYDFLCTFVNGVPAEMLDTLSQSAEALFDFACYTYDEYGKVKGFIGCLLDVGDTIGTIGYGDMALGETM